MINERKEVLNDWLGVNNIIGSKEFRPVGDTFSSIVATTIPIHACKKSINSRFCPWGELSSIIVPSSRLNLPLPSALRTCMCGGRCSLVKKKNLKPKKKNIVGIFFSFVVFFRKDR